MGTVAPFKLADPGNMLGTDLLFVGWDNAEAEASPVRGMTRRQAPNMKRTMHARRMQEGGHFRNSVQSRGATIALQKKWLYASGCRAPGSWGGGRSMHWLHGKHGKELRGLPFAVIPYTMHCESAAVKCVTVHEGAYGGKRDERAARNSQGLRAAHVPPVQHRQRHSSYLASI